MADKPPAAPPIYTIPAEYVDEARKLEDRHFIAMGRTIGAAMATINNREDRDLVAAHLASLQDALTCIANDDDTRILRLVQRAYEDGRRDGYEQLGIELGMIEKPKDDAPPPTLH